MRKITINNKEYTIEYTVEASLYNECVETILNTLVGAQVATSGSPEDVAKKTIEELANIPHTTITLFYAGLLEHHGENGDKSVLSITDAKRLAVDYIKENNTNWYSMLNDLLEEVNNDNFFELTGIDQMLGGETKEKTRRKAGVK